MRFFYKVILLITAILCCKPSFAQQFEPKEFAGVKYQEFAKLSSDDKMSVLLIYLHGKSGCGTDNERQIQAPSVWNIEKFLRESEMSIYFIAPQCPPTHEWIAHRDMPGYEDKIFELINDNYENSSFNIKVISDSLHLSHSWLCALFKSKTKYTMQQWLINVRLNKAKELLVDTDLSVSNIAYLCGFNDALYFSTSFKKMCGTSPTCYRLTRTSSTQ